jgi:hypothetical protein
MRCIGSGGGSRGVEEEDPHPGPLPEYQERGKWGKYGRYFPALQPPSIMRVLPVTMADSSEAR